MSPDFARVGSLPIKVLTDPVTLQLGCVGSQSKIYFGVETKIRFDLIQKECYLDIANLDKYDAILGMVFLRQNGISLDFEHLEIVIRGKWCVPTLIEGEKIAATATLLTKRDRKK